MQKSQGNRRGRNFCVRVSPEDMAKAVESGFGSQGPLAFGPWLLWRSTLDLFPTRALPGPGAGIARPGLVMPSEHGIAGAGIVQLEKENSGQAMPRRRILDLCGGSGAWSKPYKDAGYLVDIVTLPKTDLKSLLGVEHCVHGILAAPPCTEFSVAKNGRKRDIATALETVSACLMIVAYSRPVWWALENPGSGLLRRWLGRPRDVFQPHDFGDPWT